MSVRAIKLRSARGWLTMVANGALGGLIASARDLLIDLERHEFELDDFEGHGEGHGEDSVAQAPSTPQRRTTSTAEEAPVDPVSERRANDHKELLLAQLDRQKARCVCTRAHRPSTPEQLFRPACSPCPAAAQP